MSEGLHSAAATAPMFRILTNRFPFWVNPKDVCSDLPDCWFNDSMSVPVLSRPAGEQCWCSGAVRGGMVVVALCGLDAALLLEAAWDRLDRRGVHVSSWQLS